MATELQKRANRANSLKSTGPQTDAGKAVVRLNAVRHGLLSRAPVMAGESGDEYTALCDQLKAELSPVGVLETQLAERMAGTIWRLRRLGHIEAGILTGGAAVAFADAADEIAKSHTRIEGGNAELIALMEGINEGETIIENEAAHADATGAAMEARAVPTASPNFRAMKRC